MTWLQDLSAVVDDVVAVFSPERGARRRMVRRLERHAARQADKLSGAWDGADTSRTWADRTTSAGSADADLDDDTLDTLRQRSRDRWRNDSLGRATVGSIADNVVGSGFVPRLNLPFDRLGIKRERARELADQARSVWQAWRLTADATDVQSIDGLQHLIVASTLVSGDCFVQPLMVTDDPAARYRLKLNLIEGDRVDTPYGMDVRDRDIRSGVELGARSQPVGYWVHVAHPGDVGAVARAGDRAFRRYPARDDAGRPAMLHVFDRERIGQSRGTPCFAPVLNLFKNQADYEEAELVAAQVAACFAVFVRRQDPFSAIQQNSTVQNGQRIEELAPGMVHYLGAGEEVQFGNPTRPNSAFDAFVRMVSRRITGALGIPYELATRDFSGTTYSQARASLLEARRMFQRRQKWLVDTVLQRVWRMLLEEAWLLGDFEAGDDFLERIDLWTATRWIPPGWGWVDPQKEGAAHQLAVALGVTSRAKVIAATDGGDFEEVTRELADEQALRESLGLDAGHQAPPAQPSGTQDNGTQDTEDTTE